MLQSFFELLQRVGVELSYDENFPEGDDVIKMENSSAAQDPFGDDEDVFGRGFEEYEEYGEEYDEEYEEYE